jgi:carbonic anhydrase/acetyltransferase-like protein (isoleucine patch superfamily)
MQPTDLPPLTLDTPPSIAPSAYIAPGAIVVGDVRLAADASIWYNAVLRGDIHHIEIGPRSNIQDGCILHVTNDAPCIVGADVTVGHSANLHACTVEDACLIGIGAIVLSGAHIGAGSVVGAGAVVREGQYVEPGSLVVGVPSRLARPLDHKTRDTNLDWARKYVELAALHRQRYGEGSPLPPR